MKFRLLPFILLLAACTPEIVKRAAPPLEVLEDKEKPDVNVLPIIKSEAIAINSEKAAENYKKLLELAPDDDTRAEAQRRLADLQVQMEDDKGNDVSSEKTLRESIALYNGLLYSRPDDPQNDRVFYQLSRAYQNVGDVPAAIETLQKLTERHPKSELAGDARFRRAELLFNTKRYAEAEGEYKLVMDLASGTPFFIPAQYKFGWTRYKLGNYDGAIETFFQILERELPGDGRELFEVKAAMDGVAPSRSDITRDAVRVVSLSLAALGGGTAANEYFAKHGDTRYFPLIYNALGEQLLEKKRYTDAAEAYAAFTQRYASHARAPDFQTRVIGAYAEGGFNDFVVREKERYATVYDPAAAYWGGQAVRADVLAELRKHYEDLGKHYYAKAQAGDKTEIPAAGRVPAETVYQNQPDFLVAAKWYRRILEVFPQDRAAAEMNFMLGESLYNGGQTLDAAREYMKTAYDYPRHTKAAEAAYAGVLAYQKNSRTVEPVARPEALKLAIAAGIKLADNFSGHPEVYPVLTRSAEDLFELKDYDQSIAIAGRVLKAPRAVDYLLRRSAWSITGDSQFAQKRYPLAEAAYSEELKLTPKNSIEFGEVTEQLAASIYKQGEAAREAGDLRAAAAQFLRLGTVTPNSKIRVNAEYDAAAALIKLEDWAAAEGVLENFRKLFPGHALEADVDKKLAVAYQKDNKPFQAAQVYGRIAQRQSETPDTRREAAWLSATLFDQAKSVPEAQKAYELYVGAYPRPLARAMDARQRLVDYAKDAKDVTRQLLWMRQIIASDETAGAERSDATKAMAATAALDVGRITAADAKSLRLSAPVEKSLPQKKQAMEAAIQALSKAASYGYAEITTAATFELGSLYQDFGKALMESERPRKLSELELEQYNLLLEEQAFPFEEKAIATHENNLKRISNGLYDEWVAKSYRALAQIAPAKYGKREKGQDIYATLK